jgi:hypothetical protein
MLSNGNQCKYEHSYLNMNVEQKTLVRLLNDFLFFSGLDVQYITDESQSMRVAIKNMICHSFRS